MTDNETIRRALNHAVTEFARIGAASGQGSGAETSNLRGVVADWHASGERNLDRWREKLHEVVDEALSDFQVDHVDVVTDEEEEGNADG